MQNNILYFYSYMVIQFLALKMTSGKKIDLESILKMST